MENAGNPGKDFLTLDDLNPEGKKVLVRVDVNAPVANGVVEDSPRFVEHAATVKELAKKKARVVVLAHQGRAGEADFLPLEQHAVLLTKHVKRKVRYVDEVFGARAAKEINALKDGRVLLLENVRFLAEETLEADAATLSKTVFVQKLAPLFDAFVNDAFSAAHRAQASLVGFPELLPSYAGRVMEKEYNAISRASANPERPCVYVLGGGKPEDCFKILKHALESGSADKLILGGAIGELALIAQGKDIGAKGRWLEEKGFAKILPELKPLVERNAAKLVLANDFAYADKDGIRVEASLEKVGGSSALVFDVGSRSANLFASELKKAKTIYFKGPVGAFEQPAFELGTRAVLKAIESSHAFSVMGGGHTLSALEKFGINRKKISHVSTAGGALLAMLSGEPLPAVEALKTAANRAR